MAGSWWPSTRGFAAGAVPYRVDMAKLLPVLYAGLAVILFLGASALFLDLRDLVA